VAEIGEHIGDCEPCMNDFQRVVKDLGTLKAWRDPVPPEGLSARVLEQLASAEERRRREALGEETSWGEPVQRGLTWVVLGTLGVVMLATLVTAQSGARYDQQRRACAENLRQIGQAAAADGQLRAPLERGLRSNLRKPLAKPLLECPLAEPLKTGEWSNYKLDLRGPTYLAGDDRRNHGFVDANLLLSDGSVVTVTPAQAGLWELLDTYSHGR
jgi:hypothetical protein